MIWLFVLVIFGYLFGSIPFGLVIGKKVKGIDIRDIGSGNIGTANAIRALGPVWGGIVFACDVLKGALPVIASWYIAKYVPGALSPAVAPYATVFAGLFSIVGHNNSIFLKFKGGKGIATSFGVFIALDWRAALLGFIIYGIVVCITKYSSLGSLLGALSLPIFIAVFKQPAPYVVFAAFATALAFYKHKENIRRLLQGKERKITDKAEDDNSSGELPGEAPQNA